MSAKTNNETAGSQRGLPARAQIIEVGTRDGFQAEKEWIPTARKIEVVNELIGAGLTALEVTSFMSHRAVPQLRDAAEVIAGIENRDGVDVIALVPNLRGVRAAVDAGVDAVVFLLSSSESHNLKNLNRPRAESVAAFADMAKTARAGGVEPRGGIATAFGCPFEGDVPVATIVDYARMYRDLGMTHFTLGDTTGMATPPRVVELCGALASATPELEISLHFHNTRGIGLANVLAGLQAGVTVFESSVGGLGGCPFAPGATGNIATEDLVLLLDECGVECGVDLEALIGVARRVETLVGRELPGQVMKAGPRLHTHSLDEVAAACG